MFNELVLLDLKQKAVSTFSMLSWCGRFNRNLSLCTPNIYAVI